MSRYILLQSAGKAETQYSWLWKNHKPEQSQCLFSSERLPTLALMIPMHLELSHVVLPVRLIQPKLQVMMNVLTIFVEVTTKMKTTFFR